MLEIRQGTKKDYEEVYNTTIIVSCNSRQYVPCNY